VLRQVTSAAHGHILANAAVWSPDGEWLVYDVRSDAAGSVFDGTRIERVHVDSGAVQVLYESHHGACCGVPLVNPVDGRVAFILGPEDPTPDWEYCAWHRRGVIVNPDRPGEITNLDACDVAAPFTPGALRGGSHVHQFSPDGRLVSFTYEDHVLATLEGSARSVAASLREADSNCGETQPLTAELNQRNVAVAFPREVHVPRSHPRNHDGEFFSVIATRTVDAPRPGSDDISRAYEDAWLPTSPRELAFLGDVLTADGQPITELFLLSLPDDLTQPADAPLEGTATTRPGPPRGTVQRRLTYTADHRFPGVHGPRHWPRCSPAGDAIGLLMRDDAGVVQLWTVAPSGDALRQVTRDPAPVGSAFTWSPDGSHVAYIADGGVVITDAATGRSWRVTPDLGGGVKLRPEACVFSPDGRRVAFVGEVTGGRRASNQIFVVNLA
jgi:roadblock/LC7 domain-containing protein